MKKFHVPIPSRHSPEALWEALTKPIPERLRAGAVSPKVLLDYENLGKDGSLQVGTRVRYRPNLTEPFVAMGMRLRRAAPREGTLLVGNLSTANMTRTDVIEPNQPIEGDVEYRVEEGEETPGLLVVEGNLSMDGLAGIWPGALGNMHQVAVEHGIRRPTERFLAHVPDIIAAAQ